MARHVIKMPGGTFHLRIPYRFIYSLSHNPSASPYFIAGKWKHYGTHTMLVQWLDGEFFRFQEASLFILT